MKKRITVFSLFLVLCICASLFLTSCNDNGGISETDESGVDVETFTEPQTVSGVITNISEGLITLKLSGLYKAKWGETAYVCIDLADTDNYCEDDVIEIEFTKIQREGDKLTFIADKIVVSIPTYKPVIYLYPETTTQCSVKVILAGELTCTYPEHGQDGWQNFIAEPDGTLIFPDGKEYYCLYWEGFHMKEYDFSSGFCVSGKDTAAFLEWALAEQGLNPREANEFIIYWLPIMASNEYNVISFQTDTYADTASLEIAPAPDSLLRINMAFYGSDTFVEIEPQSFAPFERNGFTVVEWGGNDLGKR